MLIQFRVGNFLSFKDMATFSMVASHDKEHEDNVFDAEKFKLLKSAAIYGANASGKSNFFKAVSFMKFFVRNSATKLRPDEKIKVFGFLLNEETREQPSIFEIVFIHEGIRYRYGFEVDRDKIHKEWLFYVPHGKETKLFVRDGNKFEIGSHFKEGKKLQDQTRGNALFLSVVGQFNGEISKKIINWFSKLKIISGIDDGGYVDFTMQQLKNPGFKKKIMNFMQMADLGIEDVLLEEENVKLEDLPKEMEPLKEMIKQKIADNAGSLVRARVTTTHKVFNEQNKSENLQQFVMKEQESNGTDKFFTMSGPIIDSLNNGYTLLIDEIDSRLHTLLTKFIISLFNSRENNPRNAQLIFASHDTNILSKESFRRDQIWFTEKDEFGKTVLFSLMEYEMKVRKDASFEKDYISGKYGAIPIIDRSKSLLENNDGHSP